jgi:hypothetical protein
MTSPPMASAVTRASTGTTRLLASEPNHASGPDLAAAAGAPAPSPDGSGGAGASVTVT